MSLHCLHNAQLCLQLKSFYAESRDMEKLSSFTSRQIGAPFTLRLTNKERNVITIRSIFVTGKFFSLSHPVLHFIFSQMKLWSNIFFSIKYIYFYWISFEAHTPRKRRDWHCIEGRPIINWSRVPSQVLYFIILLCVSSERRSNFPEKLSEKLCRESCERKAFDDVMSAGTIARYSIRCRLSLEKFLSLSRRFPSDFFSCKVNKRREEKMSCKCPGTRTSTVTEAFASSLSVFVCLL